HWRWQEKAVAPRIRALLGCRAFPIALLRPSSVYQVTRPAAAVTQLVDGHSSPPSRSCAGSSPGSHPSKDQQRRSPPPWFSWFKMANAEPLNCNKYVSIPLRLATRARLGVPQELSLQSRSIF